MILYRGEKKDYEQTSCAPNIFRNEDVNKIPLFEKTLFEEMISKGVTKKKDYLSIAIDAQHGGFPSRLLDVSYNALVALFFATEKVKKDHEEDDLAVVHIFFPEQIFATSSDAAIKTYEDIVCQNQEYNTLPISIYNHKLIDHSKKNSRIIAQQGAFILFPGNEFFPIQNISKVIIKIDGRNKNSIREELKTLFGIHQGFIYPEPENQILDIKQRIRKIVNEMPSYKSEFEFMLNGFYLNLLRFKQDLYTYYRQDKDLNNMEPYFEDIKAYEHYIVRSSRDIYASYLILVKENIGQEETRTILELINSYKVRSEKIHEQIMFIVLGTKFKDTNQKITLSKFEKYINEGKLRA
nr:FRG domain-containing protein [Exiguobacterium sp. s124]